MLGVGMPRPYAAAVGTEVAVACIIRHDQNDVGLLLLLRGSWCTRHGRDGKRRQ